ncbi:MAG: glycosyltransferase [bacterium]|nr:glycosyltransferase [bacterium]
MKIIFINNLRLPTEKAYGQSIGSMALALSAAGQQVQVIGNKSAKSLDFFKFYNLPRSFEFTALASTKLLPYRFGRSADYVNRVLFLAAIIWQNFSKQSVFITRQPEIAWLLGILGYEVIFDAHRFPERWGGLLIYLIKRVRFVAANSYGTAAAFERANFYRLKILPNGVDLARFANLPPKTKNTKTALYLGHLYNWKGIRVILAAAAAAPDIKFKIAGGPEREKEALKLEVEKRRLNNVEFIGVISPDAVPACLATADVLIYSASANSIEAKFYTSPIKLFEYLAAGRPVVVADLPSVREVVSEQEVAFYSAGDGLALAAAFRNILQDQPAAARRVVAGRELIKNYTWDKRAEKLLTAIKETKPPFLALGAFLAGYPRNQLLLRSLATTANLEVKNYYRSWWPGLRIWLKLISRPKVKTLIVQPASYFSPAIYLANPFRPAPVIADAFTSLYDTLVTDRTLVSKNSLKAKYYHFLDSLLIKSSNGLIFDTVEHQIYFQNNFSDTKKIISSVVPVGVDIRYFDHVPAGQLLKDKFSILFYGKYIPLQGVETIIKAAKILQDQGQNDIHFTLIGSGQTYAPNKKLAADLNLTNLTFQPKTDYYSLISLMKVADVLLGVFDGGEKATRVVPNKVVEALAAGRPLITGNTPAVQRFFTDKQELFLVPTGDSVALVEKILTAKNNPVLAAQVATAGRAAVAKHFSPEAMTQSLSELISQL